MIRIQRQKDMNWKDRFFKCELVENPSPKEIKLWNALIEPNETIKESDLIDRVLQMLDVVESPENNSRALNMIFNARNNGYIIDAGIPWKHEYRKNRINTNPE